MKRILAMILFLIFSGVLGDAQTPGKAAKQYAIDVPESRVEFYVSSSDGEVYGTFASWTGQLKMGAPGHPEVATLDIDVSTPSMTTGSGMKNNIIKGKDFFYVEKYPSITFTSTKVIPSGDPNKFQVQGDFTLRGVTKPVTLQVTLDRDTKGGGQIYADLSFDRRDFDMTKNMWFVRVGDSVRVRMDLYVVPKS
jgi:polyisoprenoid-binding protein YceI